MRKFLIALTGVSILVSGCATRASGVAPVAISANEYASLSCAESRAEADAARERVNALTRRQNNAATTDAAAVFLIGLPLGSVFGGDVSGELAQAKGESLALERHTHMVCDTEASAQTNAPVATKDPNTKVSQTAAAPPLSSESK